jgi:hypothetical protein
MQHHLKSSARPAWARIIAAKFLDELLAATDDAIAAFHLRFGGEAFTPLAAKKMCSADAYLAADLESNRIRGVYF